MEALFGNLFNHVTENPEYPALGEQLTKPLNVPYLTSFTTVQGYRYDKKNQVRLMLVGRAVNGWAEKRNYGEVLDGDEYVRSSYENFSDVNPENEHDRFEWISTDGNTPHNVPREGIDPLPETIKNERYSLTRSRFWVYAMKVWCGLSTKSGSEKNEDNAWQDRWFENIVWSNLYKIAPTFGGNPSEKLKKAQFDACADLLWAEIKHFEPTHILFVTGYDGWFDGFDNKFKSKDGYSIRMADEHQKKNVFIEASGKIGEMEFVVTKRPEGLSNEQLTQAVTDTKGAFTIR